jgi:hypothetical protein
VLFPSISSSRRFEAQPRVRQPRVEEQIVERILEEVGLSGGTGPDT